MCVHVELCLYYPSKDHHIIIAIIKTLKILTLIINIIVLVAADLAKALFHWARATSLGIGLAELRVWTFGIGLRSPEASERVR